MNYEHPHITVNEVAPGHFAISNIPPCRASTEDGLVVAPSECYISPAVPTDLLLAIVKARATTPTMGAREVAERSAEIEAARNAPITPDEKREMIEGRAPSPVELEDLQARIMGAVKDGPARIGDLAESLGCKKDEIKALSGNGFEVASAGWVKLLTVGGAD